MRAYVVQFRRKTGWDDIWMFVAYLTNVGLGISLVLSRIVFDKPITVSWVHENILVSNACNEPVQLRNTITDGSQLAWVVQFFNITSLFFVKLSICFLYIRIRAYL